MAKLDPYFAVFNAHVNNAGERAMKVLEEQFPPWAEAISAFKAKGMMSIFDHELTPPIAAYTALVTAFVNEGESG